MRLPALPRDLLEAAARRGADAAAGVPELWQASDDAGEGGEVEVANGRQTFLFQDILFENKTCSRYDLSAMIV